MALKKYVYHREYKINSTKECCNNVSISELDLVPFFVTVLVCLFWSLEYGMVCGILVNVVFILYKSARPKIIITRDKINSLQIATVEVRENLCYSSAEYLKCKIVKFVNTHGEGNINLVVIKGEEITNIDCTVGLVSLNEMSIKKKKKKHFNNNVSP